MVFTRALLLMVDRLIVMVGVSGLNRCASVWLKIFPRDFLYSRSSA